MTKKDLKQALQEVEEQRDILKQALEEFEGENKEQNENSDDQITAAVTDAKKMMQQSIKSGNLKDILDKIADNIDYAKTAVISLSNITEKAQEKLDGKVEEITVAGGMSISSDMWFPIVLGLIQTQEFQHLMANMLVGIIK